MKVRGLSSIVGQLAGASKMLLRNASIDQKTVPWVEAGSQNVAEGVCW
jgi:hypothetical protein